MTATHGQTPDDVSNHRNRQRPVRSPLWRAGVAPGVFAVVYIIAQLSHVTGVPVGFCVLKVVVGIPCPGCGVTTSIEALLRGSLARAVTVNAAGPLVLLFVIAQLVVMAAAALRWLPDITIDRISELNDRSLLAVLLTVWFARFV